MVRLLFFPDILSPSSCRTEMVAAMERFILLSFFLFFLVSYLHLCMECISPKIYPFNVHFISPFKCSWLLLHSQFTHPDKLCFTVTGRRVVGPQHHWSPEYIHLLHATDPLIFQEVEISDYVGYSNFYRGMFRKVVKLC